MENRKTLSGNFAVEYNGKYFFISGDLKKVIREIDSEEFDYLCRVVDTPEEGFDLELPEDLIRKLDKEVSFIEDASMLEYFRNSAFVAVYPFCKADNGPIELLKLSENRNVLLSNPCDSYYDSCAWSGHDRTNITFYDREKNLIGDQRNASETKYASNSDPDYYEVGETMVEAIARLGIEEDLAYILVTHYDNGSYNDSTVTKWQKIYKVDLPMGEIVSEIRATADAAVAS